MAVDAKEREEYRAIIFEKLTGRKPISLEKLITIEQLVSATKETKTLYAGTELDTELKRIRDGKRTKGFELPCNGLFFGSEGSKGLEEYTTEIFVIPQTSTPDYIKNPEVQFFFKIEPKYTTTSPEQQTKLAGLVANMEAKFLEIMSDSILDSDSIEQWLK